MTTDSPSARATDHGADIPPPDPEPAGGDLSIANELAAIGASAPPGTWDHAPPSDATITSLWDEVRALRKRVGID